MLPDRKTSTGPAHQWTPPVASEYQTDRQTGSRNPAAAQGGPSPHQLHAAELLPASSNQLDGADEGRITSSWTLLHP